MFIDSAHPRDKAAKEFLCVQCCNAAKCQILKEDIKITAYLWTWLKTEVAEAARDSLLVLQRNLFNALLQHDESLGYYAVCLQELREQIAVRGVTIPDEQLFFTLAKDPQDRPYRALDEINARGTM